MKKFLLLFIIIFYFVSCSRGWDKDLLVAFVSNDGTNEYLYICTENGENVKKLTDFPAGRLIEAISFSADGTKIAAISSNGSNDCINIINTEGEMLYEKVLAVGDISGITWLLDGKLMFYCVTAGTEFPDTGSVIFDYESESIISNPLIASGYDAVTTSCYSAVDSGRCVVIDSSYSLRVVSLTTGESLYSQPGFSALPLTVSPDGETVLFWTNSVISIYTMDTYSTATFTIPGYSDFLSVSFSPDGGSVAFTNSYLTNSFYIYNVNSMSVKTITPGVGSFYPLVCYQYKPI